MQSEAAISRELMGKIVDEVFDGAIEDPRVIEEIYAVIKREEATLSKVDERKPLDLNITQDWFEKRSALEADHEIGAGLRKFRSCVNPTQDELAELFKIAHRIPDGWQLVPVAALSAAEPVSSRNDEAGYVEFLNEDVPYIVRDIQGAVAILMDLETRNVIGYRVYDPDSVFAPPAPSLAVKDLHQAASDFMHLFIQDGHLTMQDLEDTDLIPAYEKLSAALSAQVQDVAALDEGMKAAGMYTIAEMMGITPLTKWTSNPAINTIEHFSEWLDRKTAEYLRMKAAYELGDKSQDDELYEWVLAHAGVFSTIRDQLRVVTAAPAKREG